MFEIMLPEPPGNSWISPGQARQAMEKGDGAGIKIALLDSGVEIAHPDFMGRVLCEDLAVELDDANPFPPGQGQDVYGHGTAIADIIWRLAPAAQIASFRVLGPSLRARSTLVARAAERAISAGYDILHCSFGCAIPGQLPLYKTWIDRAFLAGVHVVAAGARSETNPPEWPAHFSSVMAVDCSTHDGPDIQYHAGSLVEFTAPGMDCEVAWLDGSRRRMTGSSFAAAHFTGWLARLLSVHPLKDSSLVQAVLRQALA